jgi:hypothetical protein
VTLSAQDWAELDRAAGAGTARRRLLPTCPYDLFLAVRHPPGIRMLTLRVPRATAVGPVLRGIGRLPSTSGLELELVTLSDGARELQLSLGDTTLVDVFNVLVSDVATAVAAAPDGTGTLCLIERVDRWIRLLRSLGETGMTAERQRGLFGELHMLRRLLGAGVEQHAAVSAWTGPDDANQDFQMPGLAIEVKTSAARQPRTLLITSERQLDATGCGRLLLGHLLVDERRGGDGASLNDMVTAVGDLLTSAGPRNRFDELLVHAGRLPHHVHRYDEPRYSVRGETVWRVDHDFPRITEADLRPGVGACSYRISTAGLDHHVLAPADFDELVRGADRE